MTIIGGCSPVPESGSVTVSVIDCTLDWPRYSNRFSELIPSSENFKAMKKEFPENPEIVVITGSTTGVYEDEEWIDALVEKTREYIQDGVPILGVCFGHQIIAKAMGTEIVQMDDYEIGYREINFDDTEIFRGLRESEYPFSTHQDRIEEVPENMERIAETDVCIQGIKHEEKPVFGVQFHPELTPDVARKAIRTKNFNEAREKRLLDEVNEESFERAKRTLKIFENFQRIAERRISARKVEKGIRGQEKIKT